jgi:hypothetical protein
MANIFSMWNLSDRSKDIDLTTLGDSIHRPDQQIINLDMVSPPIEFETTWEEIREFPKKVEAQLQALSERVYQECPVSAHFGVKGHGEGIVWTVVGKKHMFKVVAEKFKEVAYGKKEDKPANEKKLANEKLQDYIASHVTHESIRFLKVRSKLNGEVLFTPADIPRVIDYMMEDIQREDKEKLAELNVKEAELKKAVGNAVANWIKHGQS